MYGLRELQGLVEARGGGEGGGGGGVREGKGEGGLSLKKDVLRQ